MKRSHIRNIDICYTFAQTLLIKGLHIKATIIFPPTISRRELASITVEFLAAVIELSLWNQPKKPFGIIRIQITAVQITVEADTFYHTPHFTYSAHSPSSAPPLSVLRW